MTAEIINFPHLSSGPMVGIAFIEGDGLSDKKTTFRYPAENGRELVCDCGNISFHITKNEIYCPKCGAYQEKF